LPDLGCGTIAVVEAGGHVGRLAIVVVGFVAMASVAVGEAGDTPEAVETAAPRFPWIALQARVSATVEVDLEVAPDGVPVSATARMVSTNVKDSGVKALGLFKDDSEAAALKWRFAPTPDGDAGPRYATLTFVFTARQSDLTDNPERVHREVVTRGPLKLEVIETLYRVYSSGEARRE
jgi:hypothetical protein